MSAAFTTCVAFCAAGCGLHLVGEYRQSTALALAGKLLGSSAFVAAAWVAGAWDSAYGRLVLLGLALCWWGDMFLVARDNRRLFVLALAAFLLGHVAYGVGFGVRGLAVGWLVAGAAATVIFALAVHRWLSPHVENRLRRPVLAYIVVIFAMLALAIGAFGATGNVPLLLGASLFVISDLGVARHRFIAPGFVNRAWSVPVYFTAQLLLAGSIAFD